MSAKFSQASINRTLAPYDAPFTIPVTCKRYALDVDGRVGNFFEDEFGVSNNNRGDTPDSTEGEFKTYNLSKSHQLNIGKMSEIEYDLLPYTYNFKNSVIFKKMVHTTLVTYKDVPTGGDIPVYEQARGTNCDLHRLDNFVFDEVSTEWHDLSDWSRSHGSYKKLIEKLLDPNIKNIPSTKHLTMTWSGSLTYPQPTWKFKASFTKKYLVSLATNPRQNDHFESFFSPV